MDADDEAGVYHSGPSLVVLGISKPGERQCQSEHEAPFLVREVNVLAFGRGNHAAAADQDAGDGTLHAAENAADDRADAGARANAPGLALEAFALERLRHVGAHVVRAAVDVQTS